MAVIIAAVKFILSDKGISRGVKKLLSPNLTISKEIYRPEKA